MNSNTPESIYENICRARNESEVLPPTYSLPPEETLSPDKARFCDGALDGIALYHMTAPDQDSTLLEQAVDAAATDQKHAHELVGKWVTDGHMISVMNKVLRHVMERQQQLPPSEIYRLAVECALKGTHREEVKFGLVLLVLFDTDQNEPLKNALRILALSDEFTLYVLQIAANWTKSSQEILRIAKTVHGWGRIHAVAALEPETQEIADWLLTEGWDNTVLPAYSALECCRKGNLQKRLKSHLTDKEFLRACELLMALLDEGPVEGISAVEDGAGLLYAFLECCADKAVSPQRQKALQQIETYAGEHELSEIVQRVQSLL